MKAKSNTSDRTTQYSKTTTPIAPTATPSQNSNRNDVKTNTTRTTQQQHSLKHKIQLEQTQHGQPSSKTNNDTTTTTYTNSSNKKNGKEPQHERSTHEQQQARLHAPRGRGFDEVLVRHLRRLSC